MNGPVESAWNHVDNATQILKKRGNEFARLVDRLATAAGEGDLKVMSEALDDLGAAISGLETARSAIVDSAEQIGVALASPDALEIELLETLLSGFASNSTNVEQKVFAGFGSIFAFPIRVSIKKSENAYDIRVHGQRTSSRRPSRIASQVKEAHKEVRPPGQVAKSLYRAFRALREGTETGRATLLALYEVLAAAPTGSSTYTMDRFLVDIQVLYASLDVPIPLSNSVTLERGDFSVANAALGVPIVLPDGSQIVLGSVSFVVRTGACE